MTIDDIAQGDSASFFDRLSELAHQAADTPAVVASQSLTYGDLLDEVAACVGFLAARGVPPGSVVGVSVADEVSHLIATLSLLALGCRQITIASFDPEAAREGLCRRAGVTHLVAAGGRPVEGVRHIEWPADGSPRVAAGGPMPAVSRGALYLKTSGTTGDLNIVAFSEQQLAAQASRHADYAGERLLRLAAIEHNNSKRHRLYCVYAGGTNVFRTDASVSVTEFCNLAGVTCLDISRLHAADLLRQAAVSAGRLPTGLKLRTGGSSVPASLRHALQHEVTPELYVRYASTESGAVAMAGPGEHAEEDCTGRPLSGVVVEIVDPSQRQCRRGERGEIRLKAPGMANGYLDNLEQTQKRFRDGWFYPGDVGSLAEDGTLFVHGRTDDMMILNGVNIFPAELERALESHPAVKAAAALPISSAVHGQIPVAAVELAVPDSISARELQLFANEHLGLRAPRRILIVPELPRTGQGKLLKRELAKLFAPGGRNG